LLDNVKPVDELRALARSNARTYITKSVHPKLANEEIGQGWQFLKKTKHQFD